MSIHSIILRGLLLVVLLALFATLLGDVIDRHWIDAHIREQGLTGQLMFMAATCLLMSLGLSRQMVAFLAGYAFGFLPGLLLSMIAVTGACILTFSVARWLLGAEPTQIQAQAVYHSGGADVHFVGSLRFGDTGLAAVEASFISALQQTYTVVGREGAIELPHNAFVPWEKDAVFVLRRYDEETGQEYVIPGADEYQLMVEHFADAVLAKSELTYAADESVQNMFVLDALAEAARTSKTVKL